MKIKINNNNSNNKDMTNNNNKDREDLMHFKEEDYKLDELI